MIIETIVFCGLFQYYHFDCMTINIHNTVYVPCISYPAVACGNWYYNQIDLGFFDKDKLWHEIQHLKCRCDRHG